MTTEEQKIADASKAADDKLQEDAIVGTLGIIASCAALVPPIGTVASVVIYAGIGLFKMESAMDKAEADLRKFIEDTLSQIDDINAQKSTFIHAINRPTVPLDLYSGPPMYWIVDSEPVANEDKFYKIPGGYVDWPAVQETGGKTLMVSMEKDGTVYKLKEKDLTDIKVDNIFAAIPPKRNSTPSVCVFFWAVPIFFARLSENIGEAIWGKNYDPASKCELPGFYNTVKKDYLALYIKDLIKQGRLDSAGNWFGKIGTIIPPLAVNDIEYAERYYGRMSWVHNLALDNIISSDGTKLARTGITYEDIGNGIANSTENNYQLWRSYQALNVAPRWTAIDNKPVAQQSGYIFDLHDLLSKYHIADPLFDKLRLSNDNQDDTLYYVTTIEDNGGEEFNIEKSLFWWPQYVYDGIRNTTFYGLRSEKTRLQYGSSGVDRLGLSVYGYVQAIQDAGGFFRSNKFDFDYSSAKNDSSIYVSKANVQTDYTSIKNNKSPIFGQSQSSGYSFSVWHGNFALAPYSLFTVAKIGDNQPRLFIGTNNSSYVFMDFDPENKTGESNGKYPGLCGGVDNYDWLKRLAVMPSWNNASNKYGYYAIQDSLIYNKFGWAYNNTKDMSSRYETFNAQPVLKSSVSLDKLPANSNWHNVMPEIYEIIKIRPPLQNRTEATIKLTKAYWGEAQWAYDMAKDNPSLETEGIGFAVIKPAKSPAGNFSLGIFKIKRNQISGTGVGTAATRAYYRTNYAENKPIVELAGYKTPSPFYCGRRADARTKTIWKQIRMLPGKWGNINDTGWEDCHTWSWPYPTDILIDVADVSNKLYTELNLGEGIGRSGLSPSCIATGPTLWGDLALFSKIYPYLTTGGNYNNPTDKEGFKKTLGVSIWRTIAEMQVGVYARYPRLGTTFGQTLSDAMESKFGAFSGDLTARSLFLKDLTANKNNPTVINGKKLTPDEAADLCMNIVDTWFNGAFPRPTKKLTSSVDSNVWNPSILENVCTAHIMLKNWAIDIGKPINQKTGAKFPSEWYSINSFGLNKAQQSAIDAFNESQNAKLAKKNPLAKLNELINSEHSKSTTELAADDTVVKKSKAPIVIAASILSLLSAALAVSVIRKHKHNQSLTP